MSCPICDNPSAHILGITGERLVLRCRGCGARIPAFHPFEIDFEQIHGWDEISSLYAFNQFLFRN